MRRRVRAIDVAFLLALVAFIAVEVVSSSKPAPAAPPRDTVTHVDIHVNDAQMSVTPSAVPAGQVEFNVVDDRTNKSVPLTVRSALYPFSLPAGTTLKTLRVIRYYALEAIARNAQIGSGSLTIFVPTLAQPREDAHQVTLDLAKDGLTTPKREARLEQPMDPYISPDPQPPDTRPWTIVAPGATTIAIHNHVDKHVLCLLDGEHIAVGRARVALARPEWEYHVLSCSTPTRTYDFDFWVG